MGKTRVRNADTAIEHLNNMANMVEKNSSVLRNEYTFLGLSSPTEKWMDKSYCSKEAAWVERTTMFLPEASPLQV